MVNVSVGIDFLQFTLEVPPRTFGGVERGEDWQKMTDVLQETMAQWSELYEGMKWRVGDNRLSPYSHSISLFHPVTGIRFANIYYSAKNIDTVLIQHTGQGCSQIPDIIALLDFVQPRIGRLDVAIDVENEEKPSSYYDAYKGTLSKGFEQSPSGETFYLGSRKSDKLMRIYRYNAPHERAHLLRFEIQYRREFSRAAAWHIVQAGIREFALAALSEYPLPTEHITQGSDETFFIARKSKGDTLLWLEKQVKPAIIKLIESGEFDARQWIEELYNDCDGF